MLTKNQHNLVSVFVFVLGLIISPISSAWHGYGGHGPRHYHSERYGYNGYGNGGFYYGGGSGPSVVINVPRRYYAPACERVEVCNSFGQCWLETYCD